MNSAWIPTPQDEALRLQASATKTSTFSGTALNYSGFAPGGIGLPVAAVVSVSVIDRTDGNESYIFTVEESADGSIWTVANVVSAARTAVGVFSIGAFISQPQVRLTCTISGTTPSITYEAWLNPNIEVG